MKVDQCREFFLSQGQAAGLMATIAWRAPETLQSVAAPGRT